MAKKQISVMESESLDSVLNLNAIRQKKFGDIPNPLDSAISQTLANKSIKNIKDISKACEIVKYFLSQSPNKLVLNELMPALMLTYGVDEIEEVLPKYLPNKTCIEKVEDNKIKVSIGKLPAKIITKPKPPVVTSNNDDILSAIHGKIEAEDIAFKAAIKNRHYDLADDIIKKIIASADITLNLLSKNKSIYQDTMIKLWYLTLYTKPDVKKDTLLKLKSHFATDLKLLAVISQEAISECRYSDTIDLLAPALKSASYTEGDKIDYFNCQFNLGISYSNNYQNQEALKCLEICKKIAPNDPDVIYAITTCYEKDDTMCEVIKGAEMVNLPIDTQNMFNLIQKATCDITWQDISNINENKLSHELKHELKFIKLTVQLNSKLKSSKQTNILLKQMSIIDQMNMADKVDFINKVIMLAQLHGIPKVIKIYLETYVTGTENLSPELLETMAILDSKKESLVTKIQAYNCIDDAKKTCLHNSAATSLLSEDKAESSVMELADKHVNESLRLSPDSQEVIQTAVALNLLQNNVGKAKELANKLSENKKEELIELFCDNDSVNINVKVDQEFEGLLADYNSTKIHQYYQLKKKQDVANLVSKTLHSTPNTCWNLGKSIKIDTDDVKSIGKHCGLDYFAHIDDKILAKVKENSELFISALDKGIVHRSQGQNGVKFLGNKAVELKIDADLRLFTNKIYVNLAGKPLIKFDNYGNHAAVNIFSLSHELEYIYEENPCEVELAGDL